VLKLSILAIACWRGFWGALNKANGPISLCRYHPVVSYVKPSCCAMRYLCTATLLGIIGSCHISTFASGQTPELKTVAVKDPSGHAAPVADALDEVLSGTYFHGIPLRESTRALRSSDSVVRLIRILQDPRREDSWENAVILLGLSGDTRAYRVLTEFLRRDDSPFACAERGKIAHCSAQEASQSESKLVSSEVYFAKSNVPIALGLWVQHIASGPKSSRAAAKPEVLKYLKSCSQPNAKFWGEQISWRAENYPELRVSHMYTDLSAQCIEGLGLSGDVTASAYLEWLATHIAKMDEATAHGRIADRVIESGYPPEIVTEEFFKSFLHKVESASQTNRKIARIGLGAYYASQGNADH
jgi:hypothetical protein